MVPALMLSYMDTGAILSVLCVHEYETPVCCDNFLRFCIMQSDIFSTLSSVKTWELPLGSTSETDPASLKLPQNAAMWYVRYGNHFHKLIPHLLCVYTSTMKHSFHHKHWNLKRKHHFHRVSACPNSCLGHNWLEKVVVKVIQSCGRFMNHPAKA